MNNRDVLIVLSARITESNTYKLLKRTEVWKLINDLKSNGYELSDIIGKDFDSLSKMLNGYDNDMITRITTLLQRKASLAFELSELDSWGISILTCLDENYPNILREKLGNLAPVVIFYCGNINLLEKQKVSIIASESRAIKDDELDFINKWTNLITEKNYVLISGGSKGIEQHATQSMLDSENSFIEFLPFNMIERIKYAKIALAIQDGRCLLLSMASPYDVSGVALEKDRYKYLTLFSKKSLVIKAEVKKDNKIVFDGMLENLRSEYTNILVFNSAVNGNKNLISEGALPIESITSWDDVFNPNGVTKNKPDCVKFMDLLKSSDITAILKSTKKSPIDFEFINLQISKCESINDLPTFIDNEKIVKALLKFAKNNLKPKTVEVNNGVQDSLDI